MRKNTKKESLFWLEVGFKKQRNKELNIFDQCNANMERFFLFVIKELCVLSSVLFFLDLITISNILQCSFIDKYFRRSQTKRGIMTRTKGNDPEAPVGSGRISLSVSQPPSNSMTRYTSLCLHGR